MWLMYTLNASFMKGRSKGNLKMPPNGPLIEKESQLIKRIGSHQVCEGIWSYLLDLLYKQT